MVQEPIYIFETLIVDHDASKLEDMLNEGWRIDSGWQNPNGSLFVLAKIKPGTEIDGEVTE